MSWRSLVMLVLLAGALLSGWSLWNQRKADAPVTRAGGRPDYVLNDFEIVALDAQGRESFTLRAPRLTRDPSTRAMDVSTPAFTIPPKAGTASTPWNVRSAAAWVSPKGDEIRLRGRVRADTTDAEGDPVNVATEQLNVYPETDRATSSELVTMTQPGFTISGRGVDARLAAKRVNLLSEVKARYER